MDYPPHHDDDGKEKLNIWCTIHEFLNAVVAHEAPLLFC